MVQRIFKILYFCSSVVGSSHLHPDVDSSPAVPITMESLFVQRLSSLSQKETDKEWSFGPFTSIANEYNEVIVDKLKFDTIHDPFKLSMFSLVCKFLQAEKSDNICPRTPSAHESGDLVTMVTRIIDSVYPSNLPIGPFFVAEIHAVVWRPDPINDLFSVWPSEGFVNARSSLSTDPARVGEVSRLWNILINRQEIVRVENFNILLALRFMNLIEKAPNVSEEKICTDILLMSDPSFKLASKLVLNDGLSTCQKYAITIPQFMKELVWVFKTGETSVTTIDQVVQAWNEHVKPWQHKIPTNSNIAVALIQLERIIGSSCGIIPPQHANLLCHILGDRSTHSNSIPMPERWPRIFAIVDPKRYRN